MAIGQRARWREWMRPEGNEPSVLFLIDCTWPYRAL